MTVAKYDFTVYEKRILYRLVECIQNISEGSPLGPNISYTLENTGGIELTLPTSIFFRIERKDEHHKRKDEHHTRIKKALSDLLDKKIEFKDDKKWKKTTLIISPEMEKREPTISFKLDKDIYKALKDFTHGFRKYELETAIQLKSVYSMRFYELFSKQTATITYTMQYLRDIFQLHDKYRSVNNFTKTVIEKAKKELDYKAPYSFTYAPVFEEALMSQRGRPKIKAFTFTPVKVGGSDLKEHESTIRRLIPISTIVSPNIEKILKGPLKFSEKEIRNNYKIFHRAKELKLGITDKFISKAINAKTTTQAYTIGTLKRMIAKAEQKQRIEATEGFSKQSKSISSGYVSEVEAKEIVSSIFENTKSKDDNQPENSMLIKSILSKKAPKDNLPKTQIEDAEEVVEILSDSHQETGSDLSKCLDLIIQKDKIIEETSPKNTSLSVSDNDLLKNKPIDIKQNIKEVKEVITTPNRTGQQPPTLGPHQNNIEFKAVFQNYLHSKEIDGKYADLIKLANVLDIKFDAKTISSIQKKKHFINYIKEKTDYKHYKKLKKYGLKGDLLYSTLTQNPKNEPISIVKEYVQTSNQVTQQPIVSEASSNNNIEFIALCQKFLNDKEIYGKYANHRQLIDTLAIKFDTETISKIHKKKQFVRLIEEKTFYKQYKALKKSGLDDERIIKTLRTLLTTPICQDLTNNATAKIFFKPGAFHNLPVNRPKLFKRIFLTLFKRKKKK